MAHKMDKPTLLVVDDSPDNLDVLGGILRQDYKVMVALNGKKALRIAQGEPRPDMVLLDIMMPDLDGYEICRRLKANPATAGIPIIFITAKSEIEDERKGLELGAVDYITKPISPPIVEIRVRTQLALYDQKRELEYLVRERTRELTDTRLEILHRLGRAAEFKDNETGLHVVRMSHYTRLMAESMNISAAWSDLVFHASPMHDIGKIGIPDRVLLKPGKLDEEEWAIMRRHPEYGVAIIGNNNSELMKMSQEIALSHHEKWDGSGYPKQLKGENISLAGRIVAIADVFDALTSERPYKKAWPVEKAVAVIEKDAGGHFDPNLVPIFRKIFPEILKIKACYEDDLDFSLDRLSICPSQIRESG